jgi:hypothetical protein
LGAELVEIHKLSTKHLDDLVRIPSIPTAAELMWAQGLVAEFDNQKKFSTKKKFINHVREIIAEWSDLDILASHYGYGNDVFCTLDVSKETGRGGILHSSNHEELRRNFGIEILTPEDLVKKIIKT